jgi:hypothetical protein
MGALHLAGATGYRGGARIEVRSQHVGLGAHERRRRGEVHGDMMQHLLGPGTQQLGE